MEVIKSKKLQEDIDLGKIMEANRFLDMIGIYTENKNTLCAKPLIEAYKNGTLKKLGIEWEPDYIKFQTLSVGR